MQSSSVARSQLNSGVRRSTTHKEMVMLSDQRLAARTTGGEPGASLAATPDGPLPQDLRAPDTSVA